MAETTQRKEIQGLWDYPTAARYLGIAEQTLRRYVSDGRVPYVKIGRRCLFRPELLQEWIETNTVF